MTHDRDCSYFWGQRRVTENCYPRVGIRKVCGKMSDEEIWFSHIVIVEKDQDRSSRHKNSEVLGGRKASMVLSQYPQRQAVLPCRQYLRRPVGGAIVNRYDLKSSTVKALQRQPFEHAREQMRSVSSGQQSRNLKPHA